MTNPLEDYLKLNPNTIYSIKTISKELKIRKRTLYYYYTKSNNIQKISPELVGSGRKKLNIFQYCNI